MKDLAHEVVTGLLGLARFRTLILVANRAERNWALRMILLPVIGSFQRVLDL